MRSKHILLFLGLLLAPLMAFAGTHSITPITPGMLPNLFSVPSTDLSVSYLGQIFGSVGGGLLHGTSGQMLGHLMKTFNYAVFILAFLLLIYTVVTSVVNTAHDGEFMGREFKSFWVIMRTIGGFIMLVPNTITGYSILQWTVMWVVLQGVGLADHIWDNALVYLKTSGAVYSQPEIMTGKVTRMGGQILASEVCMYKMNQINYMRNKPQPLGPSKTFTVNPYGSPPPINPVWDMKNNQVIFPGSVVNKTMLKPYCGEYSWSSTKTEKGQYQLTALRQIVTDMQPMAKMIANGEVAALSSAAKNKPKTATYTDNQQQVLQSLISAAANYINITKPARRGAAKNAASAFKNDYSKMKSNGWLAAGAYYWDLVSLNGQYQSASNFEFGMTSCAPGAEFPACKASPTKGFPKSVTNLTNRVYGYNMAASKLASSNSGVGKLNIPQFHFGADGQKNITAIMNALTVGMTSIVPEWQYEMNQTKTGLDPMIALHSLGQIMMHTAYHAWWIMFGIMIAGASLSGWCSSVLPFAAIFNAMISWIKPVVMTVSAGLFVAGAMLSLYLPMIPFVIFTFAVFGWFLYVLEAMVAAPLVAAAITHPTGHDWLGKGTQAMMLLVGAFLRPALMVIGFITAIVITQVVFRLMNYGFIHVVNTWGLTSGGEEGAFSIVILMIMYTVLLITIMHQTYSYLVSDFPKRILEGWVGAPSTGNQGSSQEALSAMKGAGNQTSQIMGDKAGGTLASAGEGIGKGVGEGSVAAAEQLQSDDEGEV